MVDPTIRPNDARQSCTRSPSGGASSEVHLFGGYSLVRELWILTATGSLSSFDREVVMSDSCDLRVRESCFTFEVKSRTVAALIAEVGLTKVDLLHVDARARTTARQSRRGQRKPSAVSVTC